MPKNTSDWGREKATARCKADGGSVINFPRSQVQTDWQRIGSSRSPQRSGQPSATVSEFPDKGWHARTLKQLERPKTDDLPHARGGRLDKRPRKRG